MSVCQRSTHVGTEVVDREVTSLGQEHANHRAPHREGPALPLWNLAYPGYRLKI